MTKDRLKEIEAREKAATEGPWRYSINSECVLDTSHSVVAKLRHLRQSDGEFCAHARTDVRLLLDHVSQLQNQITAMRNAETSPFHD